MICFITMIGIFPNNKFSDVIIQGYPFEEETFPYDPDEIENLNSPGIKNFRKK